MSCVICTKHNITTRFDYIFDNDLIYIGHSYIPKGKENTYLGWIILETKRHIAGWEELNDEEASEVGKYTSIIAKFLMLILDVDKIYTFVLGHHVDHFHIHIVPRYINTPVEYWGLAVDEWPEAPKGNRDDINKLCNQLASLLD